MEGILERLDMNSGKGEQWVESEVNTISSLFAGKSYYELLTPTFFPFELIEHDSAANTRQRKAWCHCQPSFMSALSTGLCRTNQHLQNLGDSGCFDRTPPPPPIKQLCLLATLLKPSFCKKNTNFIHYSSKKSCPRHLGS